MKCMRSRPRAETLIESIIAVSILMLIIAPASGLFVGSIRTVAGNRSDLIASLLAEEGLEMMRNMRDTNLLKFSPKAEKCWNAKPDPAVTLDNCDQVANKIGNENTNPLVFKLMLHPDTLQWSLDSGVPETPPPGISQYQVILDTATATNPECGPGAPQPCHKHTGLYFLPPAGFPTQPPRGEALLFYRKLTLQHFDLDSDATVDAIKVTATVEYQSGSSMQKIERTNILYRPTS